MGVLSAHLGLGPTGAGLAELHVQGWQDDYVESPRVEGLLPGPALPLPPAPRPEAGPHVLQMHLLDGSVGVHGSLAYVPQQAWIIQGSIQENILMGRPLDEAR